MIGIITFHAAYNFGSALQAYATQKTITKLGFENEIINYRLNNQIHYYGDFLTLRFGRKELLRRVLCLSELGERRKRSERYELFIKNKLFLSDKEIHTYEALDLAGFT